MQNFKISFSHPWLLLLIIPAMLLALIPYFRISKKYRRTRNRIISIICYALVMSLSLCVLSGIHFSYDTPNSQNEILLLVDMSDSSTDKEDERNEFVYSVIRDCASICKVGVVTFGLDQVLAADFSQDEAQVYNNYINAISPDTSASDIASALSYAKGVFQNPKTAKVVLISDGLETDNSAGTAIKEFVANGIHLDVFPVQSNSYNDIQISSVIWPEEHIIREQEFQLTLSVQCNHAGKGTLVVSDNGVETAKIPVVFDADTKEIQVTHKFGIPGAHELSFSLSAADEEIRNNQYYSYFYLQEFKNVLLIEQNYNESDRLKELLEADEYQVTVANTRIEDSLPSTLDDLRQFDEVILVNIAKSDLSDDFWNELNSYVYEIGGGLFTVGGSGTDPLSGKLSAHAYNQKDMFRSLYQQMLPVDAITYTPPIAVMVVVDCSGSMSGDMGDKTKLDWAKEGAVSVFNSLTERDYCGVMSLDDSYNDEIRVTPATQKYIIEAAITQISGGGGTNYAPALYQAGYSLAAVQSVEKRHVILVSDGLPGDKYEDYLAVMKEHNENSGVTYSIITLGKASNSEQLKQAAEETGGRYYEIDMDDIQSLPKTMREDLNVKEIKEVVQEPFVPVVVSHNAIMSGVEGVLPELGGFYGTRIKNGAEVTLSATYAPILAHWNYGKGMVGSFMCDLNGTWSDNFMSEENGVKIITNTLKVLAPTEDIRATDIKVSVREDNYHTHLSIYTALEEGQSIAVEVKSPVGELYGDYTTKVIEPGAAYSRVTLLNTQPGIHYITVRKLDANRQIVSEYSFERVLPYSAEYDLFVNPEIGTTLLEALAGSCNGTVLTESYDVLKNLKAEIHHDIDPRIVFIILALALFLLDIAVRKFKFKWIHEIVRERKEKRVSAKNDQ